MDLKEFIKGKKAQDDYSLKMARYQFDYLMLNKELDAKIAELKAEYQMRYKKLEDKARIDCEAKPLCNHEIIVEFSVWHQYQYEPVYYCLGCGDKLAFDEEKTLVIKIDAPIEDAKKIEVYLCKLNQELTKLGYDSNFSSLEEVASHLTNFINNKEEIKR